MTQLVVVRNWEVFPARLMNKLQYQETATFGGFATVVQDWRANSTFDPNLTGVGHQPYGNDQLALFYGENIVHAAKLSIECVNLSESPAFVTILAGPIADIGVAALDHVSELPMHVTRAVASVLGGPAVVKMKQFRRTKEMADQEEKEALMGDDWDASVAAVPVRQWGFRVMVVSADGSAVNMVIRQHLVQWVEWYQGDENVGQS